MLLAPIAEQLTGLRLQHYLLRSLTFKTPRIPGRLLEEALADARQNPGLEFMYMFRFDPAEGWRVTRPQQEQSRIRVGYVERDQSDVVLELHSHNRMPAFFSPTDDNDEQGGRFYAVMGHIDAPQPELALRLGLYGHWLCNAPALTLFSHLGPFVEVYAEAPAPHCSG